MGSPGAEDKIILFEQRLALSSEQLEQQRLQAQLAFGMELERDRQVEALAFAKADNRDLLYPFVMLCLCSAGVTCILTIAFVWMATRGMR